MLPPRAPIHDGHPAFAVTFCFAAATFLAAFELFLVQPLIARYILPWFGGGAAVWTTCLVFFQAMLLAGYLYAHLGVSRLRPRTQAIVHVALLFAVLVVSLPAIVPSAKWQPPAGAAAGNPVGRILLLLAATLGLPCLALSATSPLLQSWYARLRPGAAVYRLYALSNLGSLLALLAYPLLVEPLLSRRTQASLWSLSLGAFGVLCGSCAVLAARAGGGLPEMRRSDPVPSAEHGALRVVLWLALPTCSSVLLLATTNTMTQDLAPVPLLWIIPLTLYLLTFVVAFDRPAWYRRSVFGWLLAASVAGAVWVLATSGRRLPVLVGVGGIVPALLLGCFVLHGELARLKPAPARLTRYYLAIAAGGVLGGVLVAVAAPLLLRSYAELPIALWGCCALALLTPWLMEAPKAARAGRMLGIAGLAVLAPLLWWASRSALPGATLLSSTRDFYGVLTLWELDAGQGRVLLHGRVTHGHQFQDPGRRATPTTYFHAGSGVGLVLGEASSLPRPRRVGVIGLGAGTLAAYAQAGDVYRFYEISPSVARIAQESFTYLGDAVARGAACDVVLGDGRLSLQREPADRIFDALVLDAFSGDAIPVHLLTHEAFDLYARHLTRSGIVSVHVSNNYADLRPVLAAAARRMGWRAVMVSTDRDDNQARFAALWVLLSPDPQRIEDLRRFGAHRPPPELPGFEGWSDEHVNLLRILR